MFTAELIQSRLKEQPFTPLQIVTTTGKTYDIHHPDLVYVSRHYLTVGTPGSNPTISEQDTRIAIIHVTELRDLPLNTAATADHSED